jgi:hypothetical protein
LRVALSQPSLWIPALTLLLPTFALQVAAPTYLRTRLSPSPLFVIAGGLLLVLLTQMALPATIALVHARRTRTAPPDVRALLRLSALVGVRTFLGLIAGVIPGLWLQARYAFAPMLASGRGDALRASGATVTPASNALLMLAALAVLVSLFGQSLVAVLNEALGVVHAVGSVDGRTIFGLNYPAHVVTAVVAHVTAAAALTVQAVGTSVLYEASTGTATLMPEATAPVAARRSAAVRVAQAAAVLALAAGIVATVYKFQQHMA